MLIKPPLGLMEIKTRIGGFMVLTVSCIQSVFV